MPVVDLPPPLIATSNQQGTTTSTTNWPILPETTNSVTWQTGGNNERCRNEIPEHALSQWQAQMVNTNEHWTTGLHYHDGNFFRTATVVGNGQGSQLQYIEPSHHHQQPGGVQSILASRPFEHNEKYLEELEIMQASDIIAFESPVSRSLPSEGPPLNRQEGNRVDGNNDSMCLHSDSSSACDEYVVTSLDQVTGEYRTQGLGHLSPDANQLAWGLRRLYQTNLPTQDRPRDLLQAASQADWREEYLNHQVISCPPNSAVKVEPST